jgi:hypothetical protein
VGIVASQGTCSVTVFSSVEYMGKSPQDKAQFLKRQHDEGENEEGPSVKYLFVV